jgi:hypothetical protein
MKEMKWNSMLHTTHYMTRSPVLPAVGVHELVLQRLLTVLLMLVLLVAWRLSSFTYHWEPWTTEFVVNSRQTLFTRTWNWIQYFSGKTSKMIKRLGYIVATVGKARLDSYFALGSSAITLGLWRWRIRRARFKNFLHGHIKFLHCHIKWGLLTHHEKVFPCTEFWQAHTCEF